MDIGDDSELHAAIELIGVHCHLKHSKTDPAENHPAVEYLCQGFGKETSTDFGDAINCNLVDFSVRIPICQECSEALLGEDWVLFYCISCGSSQWLCKKYSKFNYPFWLHIKWMDTCPMCYETEQITHDDHD